MPAGARVFVSLSQTEVDYIDYMLMIADTYQEVVWLDISVQEATLVNELNTLKHLDGKHQDSLKAKLAATVLVQILEGRS